MNRFLSMSGIFCITIICSVFAVLGMFQYEGTAFLLLIFNIAWIFWLFLFLLRPFSYIYFFSSIFLFLGFWVKFTLHLISGEPFIEPISKWWTSCQWDDVVLVSTVVVLVLLSIHSCLFLLMNSKKKINDGKKHVINTPPLLYQNYRKTVWVLAIIASCICNIANFKCRFYATGLSPLIILPWHLNAMIVWVMLFFTPICFYGFIGWDCQLNKGKCLHIAFFLIILLTSVTTFSRAIFLLWGAPYFLVRFEKNNTLYARYSKKKFIIFVTFTLIVAFAINQLRYNYLADSYGYISSINSHLVQTIRLFVDRWVGLEGVMSATSYLNKGMTLFLDQLIKTPINHHDMGFYNTEILELPHSVKNNFSSLPGIVAILNYSGSLFVVYFGLLIAILVLVFVELFLSKKVKNKYVIAQMGIIISYWCVVELNIPYTGFINLFECIAAVIFLFPRAIIKKQYKLYFHSSDKW